MFKNYQKTQKKSLTANIPRRAIRIIFMLTDQTIIRAKPSY